MTAFDYFLKVICNKISIYSKVNYPIDAVENFNRNTEKAFAILQNFISHQNKELKLLKGDVVIRKGCDSINRIFLESEGAESQVSFVKIPSLIGGRLLDERAYEQGIALAPSPEINIGYAQELFQRLVKNYNLKIGFWHHFGRLNDISIENYIDALIDDILLDAFERIYISVDVEIHKYMIADMVDIIYYDDSTIDVTINGNKITDETFSNSFLFGRFEYVIREAYSTKTTHTLSEFGVFSLKDICTLAVFNTCGKTIKDISWREIEQPLGFINLSNVSSIVHLLNYVPVNIITDLEDSMNIDGNEEKKDELFNAKEIVEIVKKSCDATFAPLPIVVEYFSVHCFYRSSPSLDFQNGNNI